MDWHLLRRYILFGVFAGALAGLVSVFLNVDPVVVGTASAFAAMFLAGSGIGTILRT